MWLMDCKWRKCFFLADEVEPPLAKPPEMVLMVPRKGGLAGVMLVWAGCGCWSLGWVGWLLWLTPLGCRLWSCRGGWWVREEVWSSLRMKRRKWPARTSSSILSWSALHSLMSAYFCPHLMFNYGYLIKFVCLKSDLIDNSDN